MADTVLNLPADAQGERTMGYAPPDGTVPGQPVSGQFALARARFVQTLPVGGTQAVVGDQGAVPVGHDGTLGQILGEGSLLPVGTQLAVGAGVQAVAGPLLLATAGANSYDLLQEASPAGAATGPRGVLAAAPALWDGTAAAYLPPATARALTDSDVGTGYGGAAPMLYLATAGRFLRQQGDAHGSAYAALRDPGGTNVALVTAAGALKVDGSAATQPISVATMAPLVAGTATIGAVTSTIEQQAKAGNAFVWSPGRLAVGAGASARVLLANPAGASRTLYLYAHFLTADVAGAFFATLYRNPSTNLPALGAAGAGVVNQALGGATVSGAQVGADASAAAMAAGTGTALTAEAVIGVGRMVYAAALFILAPGQSLGLNVPCPTFATGIMPEFAWWEL